MAAGFGVGASLANMGQDQLSQATKVLSEASNQESKRNAENQMLKAQEKAGKRQLGSTLGATALASMATRSACMASRWAGDGSTAATDMPPASSSKGALLPPPPTPAHTPEMSPVPHFPPKLLF